MGSGLVIIPEPKGQGVWDLDGREYLDMSLGGVGTAVLGYADDEVDDAVSAALRAGVSCSLNCPEEVELAELLCELHPWARHGAVHPVGRRGHGCCRSHCPRFHRKDTVAFCGYHGWSDWYLAANVGDRDALKGHLMGGLEAAGVPEQLEGTALPFHYNRLDELEAIIESEKGRLAAIVMEPLRGQQPDPEFIAGVRAAADRIGAVLIMDEISAGFRYTTGGAHLVKLDIDPDMAVFSKALGNGYAISAVIGRREIMEVAGNIFISSTNWTERVGFAAALATVRKHRRENVADHLVELGSSVQEGWRKLGVRHGLDVVVGGMDPMGNFHIEHPDFQALKAYFIECMLERGFLASSQCYIMQAHTREDVDAYLGACDECFGLLAQAVDSGDVHERLKGAPSIAGFQRLA